MTTNPKNAGNGRKPTGRECWCSSCGLMFGGSSAFDEHRKGEHPHRRCLTPEELATNPRVVWNAPRQTWGSLHSSARPGKGA